MRKNFPPQQPQGTTFRILKMDCIDAMAKMPEGSVDLVVTSPPYNLGINYGRYRDRKSREAYLHWTALWVQQVARVLKEDGSFFLNLGSAPSNPALPFEVICQIQSTFVLQNTIHWIKSIALKSKDGNEISMGHFKPIQGERFLNDCHEFLFHLTKTGTVKLNRLAIGVPYADKSNVARWAHTRGNDLRCRGNTWFIPYKTIWNRALQRPHPATFPEELVSNCIKLHGAGPRSVMLDPFLGIGNSAIAAKQTGIGLFVGFDIDDAYLRVARDRLEIPLESNGSDEGFSFCGLTQQTSSAGKNKTTQRNVISGRNCAF